MSNQPDCDFDLFVIGGGINGCGIARDAAGRGLRVGLAEMNDLASATSSASTKLFHGGLRYLEFFEFRLVREALQEREVLLRNMPHISWPMRFVLPYHREMRFPGGTPTSNLLSKVMPWMKDRRPAWLIRLGLFMYDTLGGRTLLPGTTTVDLETDACGRALQSQFKKAYEYSDCWVDDARLVVLNARDAAARGGEIMPRTKVMAAEPKNGIWTIRLASEDGTRDVRARMVVNAGGPWAGDILGEVFRKNQQHSVRLVRGSHIVTRKLYDHDKCYFFQGTDGRIIFAIPYEQDFTLIGTTDQEHEDPATPATCTEAETEYLLGFASDYFATPVSRDDIVWTYSGVRPLYDDGASSATAATRDYVLSLDTGAGAPVLSVFGGKITTYRRLAEEALTRICAELGGADAPWTAKAALPGGDFAVDGKGALTRALLEDFPFLDDAWAARLIRTYGTEAAVMLSGAKEVSDLGRAFGATITARELDWAMQREWARCADDFLWRRTKLGLRLNTEQATHIEDYFRKNLDLRSAPLAQDLSLA